MDAWKYGISLECSTLYLTSERSVRVRYRVGHEKRSSISPSNRVSFCSLSKHVDNGGQYLCFKKRTRCHSFMALNREVGVSSAD